MNADRGQKDNIGLIFRFNDKGDKTEYGRGKGDGGDHLEGHWKSLGRKLEKLHGGSWGWKLYGNRMTGLSASLLMG